MKRKYRHALGGAGAWLVWAVHAAVTFTVVLFAHALSHPASALGRRLDGSYWTLVTRVDLLVEAIAPALLALALLLGMVGAEWARVRRGVIGLAAGGIVTAGLWAVEPYPGGLEMGSLVVLAMAGAYVAAFASGPGSLSNALRLTLAAAAMVVLGETRQSAHTSGSPLGGVDAITAHYVGQPWPSICAAAAMLMLLLAARCARRTSTGLLWLGPAFWLGTRALRAELERGLAAAALRDPGTTPEWGVGSALADGLDWGGTLGAVLLVWFGVAQARRRRASRRAGVVLMALTPLALSLVLSPFDLPAQPGATHRSRAAQLRAVLATTQVAPIPDPDAFWPVPDRAAVVDADNWVHLLDGGRWATLDPEDAIPSSPDGVLLFLDRRAPSEQLVRVARRVTSGPVYLGRAESRNMLGTARFAVAEDRTFMVSRLRVYRPDDDIVPFSWVAGEMEATRCVELHRVSAMPLEEAIRDAPCLIGPAPTAEQAAAPRWRTLDSRPRYGGLMPRPTGRALAAGGVLALVMVSVERRGHLRSAMIWGSVRRHFLAFAVATLAVVVSVGALFLG